VVGDPKLHTYQKKARAEKKEKREERPRAGERRISLSLRPVFLFSSLSLSFSTLEPELGAPPVAALGIVPNLVARAEADPLRDRPVLLRDVRELLLDDGGLVGRLFVAFFFVLKRKGRGRSRLSERESDDERSQREAKTSLFFSGVQERRSRQLPIALANVRPRRILAKPARFKSRTRHERLCGRQSAFRQSRKGERRLLARARSSQRASSIEASRGPGEPRAASFSHHGEPSVFLRSIERKRNGRSRDQEGQGRMRDRTRSTFGGRRRRRRWGSGGVPPAFSLSLPRDLSRCERMRARLCSIRANGKRIGEDKRLPLRTIVTSF